MINDFKILCQSPIIFFPVWLYSVLSILGISLCGLLGVAVIPFMDKNYYQDIIQFLVALAVGTLAGDALLHLLPHVSRRRVLLQLFVL